MATSPLKLFLFIRTQYRIIAILQSQINPNHFFNKKVLSILFLYTQFLIALVAFMLFKAKSIGDVAFSYCMSISILLCVSFLIIAALKISNIFILIDEYEELIRKSESEAC